jgi:hypothetical protein
MAGYWSWPSGKIIVVSSMGSMSRIPMCPKHRALQLKIKNLWICRDKDNTCGNKLHRLAQPHSMMFALSSPAYLCIIRPRKIGIHFGDVRSMKAGRLRATPKGGMTVDLVNRRHTS